MPNFDPIPEQLNRIERKLDLALHGEDGKSGLIVEVDRLKQTADRQRWTMRTIGAAVMGLLANFFQSLLSR